MIPSACSLWMYYLNNLAKENIWHLWSFWLSLKSKNCVLSQYQRSAFVGGRKSEGINTNCYRIIRHHSTLLAKTLWLDGREMCSTEEALTLNSLLPTASTRAASTVDVLLRGTGWSSGSTFTRFYKKEPAVNMG